MVNIIERKGVATLSQTPNGDTSWRSSFAVPNASSEAEAIAIVQATVPVSLSMLSQLMIRQNVTAKERGRGMYHVDVEYGPPGKNDEAKVEGQIYKFSFDTTGGTHKVTVGERQPDPETEGATISQVWKGQRSDSDPAPDLMGAIGWDGKQVHGVEVVVPKLSFEIVAYYPPAAMTTEFVANLARATGKMNKLAWHDFEAGELRFDGASGAGEASVLTGVATAPVPVTLRFAASENLTDHKVGSIIVPSKKGWDYLDVKFDKIKDEGKVYPLPNYAYVHRVCKELEFESLFGF